MTPDRPSDPPLQTTALAGGSFAWCSSGQGPTVVAVHGAPGSGRDFRWLAPALDGVRFVRLDLPGYGRSDWASGPGYTLAARGRFVAAALDALEIEDCTLLGHSQGGGVATAAALASGRVTRLALLASIGPRVHQGFKRTKVRQFAALLSIPGVPTLMRRNLEAGFEKAGFPTSLTHEQRLLTMKSSGRISFREHRRNLEKLTCPTFVAWAADDRLVEDAVSKDLAAVVPDGPRLRFEAGGHNLQKTMAVELGEALGDWVRES